jgi:hypothetical protein
MMEGQALTRPFSNWSIEPFPDEPAHGYFLRLVANEEHHSAKVYANEIGIDGRAVDPSTRLDVILRLPLPEEWRERLLNATPRFDDGSIVIAGHAFADRQWAIPTRRYCPGCLAEAAYHRAWWDIEAVETCPHHGVPLNDAGPDGKPVPWWWPHIGQTPTGDSLGLRMPRVDCRPSFEAYLLGRLGFGDPFPAPLLDGAALAAVIPACESLGKLLRSPWLREHPDKISGSHEIGYQALSEGPARLVETLREWVRREVPERDRRRGHDVTFGWLNARRRTLLAPFPELFQNAMKKAVAADNRPKPRVTTDADFHDPAIGIEALAQELAIARRGVAFVAARLGILPERGWYRARVYFDSGDVALIREYLADIVTVEEATAIVGLPKFQLMPLVRTGFLTRIPYVSSGARGYRFERAEAERLVADVVGKVRVGKMAGTISLRTMSRHLKVEPGAVAALVADGRIVPACRQPDVEGFVGLRFWPSG